MYGIMGNQFISRRHILHYQNPRSGSCPSEEKTRREAGLTKEAFKILKESIFELLAAISKDAVIFFENPCEVVLEATGSSATWS